MSIGNSGSVGRGKKSEGEMKDGQQWIRVNGPDLCKRKIINANHNLQTKNSQHFKDACNNAGVKPSLRQASKFGKKIGAAYNFAHGIEMSGFHYPNK